MPKRQNHVADIQADVEKILTQIAEWTDQKREAGFIAQAVSQACIAALAGNYGIGAILVHEGKVVARGHNRLSEVEHPFCHVLHAEVDALRNYHESTSPQDRQYREIVVYTTLEPCPMCTCAMFNVGIKKVVVGSIDEWAGQLISHPHKMPPWWLELQQLSGTTHRLAQETPGELLQACRDIFILTKDIVDKALRNQ